MNLNKIVHHQSFGGGLLVAAAVVAMLLANSPASGFYVGFLDVPVEVVFGSFEIAKPLLLWANDGLMALFFLLIGLEIKREVLDGNLFSRKQIILPAIGVVAGIVFPALIYVYFTINDPIGIRGWAIPSATDIAFAIGVFTLFGTRLPLSLKLLLLSAEIFDDIGAIVIIALFYSAELSTASLMIGIAGLVILFLLNRFKVNTLSPYVVVGMIVWVAVLKSGVHATLAGFAIAWFIPLKLENANGNAMLPGLEHALHPWIAFFVLPSFVFANAGIDLGLFVGKQIGIFGMCWFAIKLKVAELPEGASWPAVLRCLLALRYRLHNELVYRNACIRRPRTGLSNNR
jgi:NhaA family Na+:H+ antiporter